MQPLQLVLEVWDDSLRVEEVCSSFYTEEEELVCVQDMQMTIREHLC